MLFITTGRAENLRYEANHDANKRGAGLLPVVQGDVSEADRGYGRPLGAACSLPESRGRASGGVWGKAPRTGGALQWVNLKTVRWTVWGEGTLCKRERSLLTAKEQLSCGLCSVQIKCPYLCVRQELLRKMCAVGITRSISSDAAAVNITGIR